MVGATRPHALYSLTDSTPARTIWVYRNGDPFYLGRKFIINHRYVPTFEAFMIQLNEGVPTPFGVRNLYTPRQGHVITDLPDLQQGGRYVVAGREKFRKLNVFTNGDILIPPVKILIPKFTLNNWNGVLGLVNEKVVPRSGGIHRLFTLNGQPVYGPDKLEDNQFYIACGKERFQRLPYWQHPKVPENIRRAFSHSPEPPEKPPLKKPPGEAPKQGHRVLTPMQVSTQGEGDRISVFYAKPEKTSHGKAPRPLSPNDGHSVYIARKSPREIEGAHQIQEDKDVQVEIPIDQVPAEVIQDEEIYSDLGSIKDQAPAEIVQDETIDAENIEEQAKEGEKLQEKKGVFKKVFGFFFSRSKKTDIKENDEKQDVKKQMGYSPDNDQWDIYDYD
ncbi:doublecortin domain-containing protein 2C [Python bivittatus]|uniref:Doublecortin domain-containing protein 2C n=1 Tax=Python bivittatus TaxID=176946 RepID=A0A9F5MXA7_PYTBI|nr:doublecortin domain-containing protein 2C [Python bivittatus]